MQSSNHVFDRIAYPHDNLILPLKWSPFTTLITLLSHIGTHTLQSLSPIFIL